MASQTILKMLQPKGRTVHVGAQAGPDGAMKQLRQYLMADGMLFGKNDIWHAVFAFSINSSMVNSFNPHTKVSRAIIFINRRKSVPRCF
jgi:hypothetical protein